MVDPEIHDIPLGDQLAVDFIHQMSWLLKYNIRDETIFLLLKEPWKYIAVGSV